jgi:outer membrane receptor for ferrienterochelin and colicin
LVANRNVVFNIARAYEKLQRYPEAFRSYDAALAAEPDPAARQKLQAALDQLRPHVAVLDIATDPPGATIFIDRRDLGPRGESPRALGLPAGSYKVIAELAGHYPAETDVAAVRVGSVTAVKLTLPPILGSLRIEGPATGAAVAIDGAQGPHCTIPCALDLPPGRHVLHLELAGFRPADLLAEISAKSEVVLRPRLEQRTGTAVVATDEPGALVEVDGKQSGFTPAVLTLPVGTHHLRISARGYRASERELLVREDAQSRVDAVLIRAEEVASASRVTEDVEDAPSSVTIIPREELLAFAYPTIAEAVRGVRGMYTWYDRSYQAIGARGLGTLTSYSNHELVLFDGHPINDDWVGSGYVGYDARTDLADLERIEVVRGPGSVLYGTNAFSGVINAVSRYEGEPSRSELGLSTAQAGVARARARSQAALGDHAGVWASVAGAHGSGRDFFFPELVDPSVPDSGHARAADGFDAGSAQGRVWWRWLTLQAYANTHDKQLPSGEFETLLGDPRTHQEDTRSFLEARAEPVLSEHVQLFSRVYWNLYRFRGTYAYDAADGGPYSDHYDSQWAGAEQRVVLTPIKALRLTAGAEGQLHYRVHEQASDDDGLAYDETGHTFQVGALYALADVIASEALRFSGGLRVDAYSTFGTSLNPRAAVIFKPYAGGNTKLLGGKAFRAPSLYELYYNDGGITQIAGKSNGNEPRPESIYSLELEHSHRISATVTALASVYANYVKDLLVTRGSGDEDDPLQYVNSATPLLALGAEVALRREWRRGWMVEASYGLTRAHYLASESAKDLFGVEPNPDVREVANAPIHLASLKAAAPIVAHLTAATRVTVEGPRYDRNESVDGDPQGRTDTAVIWDLVLSGQEERWGLQYALGVYNAADWHYALPLSSEFTSLTMPQDGRTFLASASITF